MGQTLTSQVSSQEGPALGVGAQGGSLGIPPVPQRWAFVRVRSSEKYQPFPRTELETQVDLAEAGGGVDAGFVVVSPAAQGESVQGPRLLPADSVGGRCWKT